MAKMSMTKPMKIGPSTSKGAAAGGLSCIESTEWAYSREGLDGGITKYRVFEVHWNISDFLARLNNLKSGVRCWETVMLGEQKVTLALEREARYHAPRQVPNTTPVLYDDWLHLDLRNTSEDILWLHSVEVSLGPHHVQLKRQCQYAPVDLHFNERVKDLDKFVNVDRLKKDLSKNTSFNMIWKIKVECGGCQPTRGQLVEDRSVLANQFYQLYKQDILTDYTLTCAGEQLKVHRAVLAARSEYWKALLTSGMVEAVKDSSEVLAVSLPTLRLFLEFVYTGKVAEKLEPRQMELLLEAADFYGVYSLKEQCEEGLIASLEPSNLMDRLVLGDTYSASNLRRVAKQMLVQNMDWLVQMPDWKKKLEERVALALEVMEDLAKARLKEVVKTRGSPVREVEEEEEYQEVFHGQEPVYGDNDHVIFNDGVPVAQMF